MNSLPFTSRPLGLWIEVCRWNFIRHFASLKLKCVLTGKICRKCEEQLEDDFGDVHLTFLTEITLNQMSLFG